MLSCKNFRFVFLSVITRYNGLYLVCILYTSCTVILCFVDRSSVISSGSGDESNPLRTNPWFFFFVFWGIGMEF